MHEENDVNNYNYYLLWAHMNQIHVRMRNHASMITFTMLMLRDAPLELAYRSHRSSALSQRKEL